MHPPALDLLTQAQARAARGDRVAAADDARYALHLGLPGPVERARALVLCGDSARQENMHRTAVDDYTAAIEADPGCAAAYLGRGLSRLVRDDPDGAAADFARVLELDPEPAVRAAALRERGRAAGAAGDADLRVAVAAGDDEAASLLAARSGIRSAAEYLRFGHWLAGVGREPEAVEAVARAVELGADDLLPLADLYVRVGRYDEAVDGCTRVLAEDPDNALAYALRGRAHYEAERDDAALDDLDRALTRDPQMALATRIRGEVHLANGRYAAAVAELTRAIELAPWDGATWYYRALCHDRLGDPVAKQRDLLAAELAGYARAGVVRRGVFGLETADDFTEAGIRCLAAGAYDDAVANFERAAQLWRQHTRVADDRPYRRLYLAVSLRGLAKVYRGDDTVADLEAAVQARPSFFSGHLNLARAHVRRGEPALALAPLAATIRLETGWPGPRLEYAAVLQSLQRHQEAVDQLTAVVSLRASTPAQRVAAYRARSAAYQALDLWDEAVADLEQAKVAAERGQLAVAWELPEEIERLRKISPRQFERDSVAARAEEAAGRVALLPVRELPNAPSPVVVPGLPAGWSVVSVSPDGDHLIAGSPTLLRERRGREGVFAPLLQGGWYVGAVHLADGLGAALADGRTAGFDPDDPDMRTLLEVRGYRLGPETPATDLSMATPPALFLVDLAEERGTPLLTTITVRARTLHAVLGGRILVLRRPYGPGWHTAVLAVQHRRLVLLARLGPDVGDVYEADGRVYGSAGYEFLGLAEALQRGTGQRVSEIPDGFEDIPEPEPVELVVSGAAGLRLVPVVDPPTPARIGAAAHTLLGRGDWLDTVRNGPYAFALTYQGDARYRASLLDGSTIRPIEPPLLARRFQYAFRPDASALLLGVDTELYEVDCASGTATPLAGGEPVVAVAAVADRYAVIRRRVEYAGRIEFYPFGTVTPAGEYPCGHLDVLESLAGNRVLLVGWANDIAPENHPGAVDCAGVPEPETQLLAVRADGVRVLGSVATALSTGWQVDDRSFVGRADGRYWELIGVDAVLDGGGDR
ncbi:MAG: tetratricopeptide repeat protein [Actinobacteria bacterium]|nr:MAG: tetratricopeptide repeat protein [Actinomycetota bacterium]